jgi:CubicO group peptidase (beta-lactamase class C family)
MELEILVDFTGEGDAYTAVMDIPQQGAVDLPVTDISVTPAGVHFQILSGPQTAYFDGMLNDNDEITGVFAQSGVEGSFTLRRVDEEVAAPPIAATYIDPLGRFSTPIPTNWTVSEQEGFVTFADPDESLRIHAAVIASDDAPAAIAAAWTLAEPDFGFPVREVLEPPSQEGVERTVVVNYSVGSDSRFVQGYGQLHDGATYVLLFDLGLEGLQRRAAQINTIVTGFKIIGAAHTDLSAVQPKPFDPALAQQWSEFITDTLDAFHVPGAAVAVVQNGEVVFSQGFGFADRERQTPMTPATHMMIGSTGKSLTTLLMATLVDDGLITWDTRAVEIDPGFAVADPELSQTLTMRNLVCACTGVPRRDLELAFNSDELTAADIISSLATFEFFTAFGETFQYSNQLVATAGYLAGMAAGGDRNDPYAAYAQALKERVLDPMGMENTTLSFDEVRQRDAYATPHAIDLSYVYRPISLEVENLLTPVAPAGAHWSTLEDMTRYMIMQLNGGVASGGTRVVSTENLTVTRTPQVAISAQSDYGLGWMVSSYKGQPVIQHGGNTIGFTSEFAFLPQANLGVIVLANAQGANGFTGAVSTRLLELLFDLPSEVEPNLEFTMQQMEKQRTELAEKMGDTVDVQTVTPWLGNYSEPALGAIALEVANGELILDTGEFRSRVRPYKDENVAFDGYVLYDPPLPGVTLRLERNEVDAPIVILGQGLVEYTFMRND